MRAGMLARDGSRRRSRPPACAATRHLGDRIGDARAPRADGARGAHRRLVVFAIIWQVADGAWPAIKHFELNFLWDNDLERAVTDVYGARDLIIGTRRDVVRRDAARRAALDRDRPLPQRARAAGDPWRRSARSIDMLAAVPSVVSASGASSCSPRSMHSMSSRSSRRYSAGSRSSRMATTGRATVFTAIVVLTIMAMPITSSICRELFLGVPDGARGGVDRPRRDPLGDGQGASSSRT